MRTWLDGGRLTGRLGVGVSDIDYNSIADIYDLYVNTDIDVPFFLSEATKTHGPVLELTAGTGRLSIPLLEAGVKLTCVDSSPGMLDVLSRKLVQRGLRADIHCLDICRLELVSCFALVILPFQSFMEIIGEESQRAVLAATHAVLVPGGRFICTMHNPTLRRAQVDGLLRVVGRFPTSDGTLVVSGFEQGGQPAVARLQFFELLGPDGHLRWKRLLPMEFTLVERHDFESMARNAGFSIAALYGNYDRAPFDPERSPVMIWTLEKSDA